MFVAGVTGGMGSGKTTALAEFARLGGCILDADEVVHGLYAPGTPVTAAVRERWGAGVLAADGSVHRPALAERVFAAPAELAWLTTLVHPAVRDAIAAVRHRSRRGLFCGVPLLFEAGWDADVDVTVAVWCDPLTQAARLAARGWDAAETQRRQRFQLDMDTKLNRADYGIVNTGTPAVLHEQCRRVFQRIVLRFGSSSE